MNSNMHSPDVDETDSFAEMKAMSASAPMTTTGRAPSETDITLVSFDDDITCFDDENILMPPTTHPGGLAQEPCLSEHKAPGNHLALSTRPKLVCTRPTCTRRFDQGIMVNPPKESWTFKPLETLTNLSASGSLPEFWSTFIHPDGLRYFKLACPQLKFTYITECDIFNQAILLSVSHLIYEIERKAVGVEKKGSTLPEDVEVYLDVVEIHDASEEAEEEWRYYMVHIATQRIFWLDEFDAAEMAFEIGGVAADSKAVFEHKVASEYWMHMENFPHRTIPANAIKTLTGILMQWSIDQMTSLDSTAPYNSDDLQKLTLMVDKLKELQTAGETNEYLVFSVSRLMGIIMSQRFIHLHGCRGARVTRYQRIRGPPGRLLLRSLPFKLISALVFGEPETMLRRIDKVWIDDIIQMLAWKEHTQIMETDWRGIACCAAVILLLNTVLFSSLPDVTQPVGLSLMIRTLSQVSVFASAGSAACGVALHQKMKNYGRYSASQAALYMQNVAGSRSRSELTAAIYSIPYALLLWSAISFVLSLGLMFANSSVTGINTKLIESSTTSFFFGTVILLFLSTVCNGRGSLLGGNVDNDN